MFVGISRFIHDPDAREDWLINFIFALLMCNVFMGFMKVLFWVGVIVP